jgi:hypothetical protein
MFFRNDLVVRLLRWGECERAARVLRSSRCLDGLSAYLCSSLLDAAVVDARGDCPVRRRLFGSLRYPHGFGPIHVRNDGVGVIANCGPGLCEAKTPGCMLSTTPDPACNPSLTTEEVCDGGAYALCQDGYAVLTVSCGWCGVDAGLLCRGYIGDDCSQMPCAPPLTCHAFAVDGGGQQRCSAACQAPADCIFTTGRGGGLGDGGGPGPSSNWAGPGEQNPNCVDGWCVPGPI